MRTTKKALSIVLAGLMTVGGMSVFSVSAAQTSTPTLSFKTQNALYAHAVSGSDDSDAWVAWQCKHNEDMEELNTNRKYFFLPSSVSSTSVELYNAYSKSVTVNNVTIPSGESREVSYTIDKAYYPYVLFSSQNGCLRQPWNLMHHLRPLSQKWPL